MDLSLLFDRLFLLPFVNGLLLAVVLPVLGAYIRLREEWLASLGLAQAAAAGVVLGAFFVGPVALIALAAAAVAAGLKGLAGKAGNDNYALMILFGWSVALLAAANSPHGDDVARALVQGQIYFTGLGHLVGIAGLHFVGAPLVIWMSPRLMIGRFFPGHFRANRIGRSHELFFDLLVALTLALAATTIGVMAAFALVFVPPWVAFRFARGWRGTLLACLALGVAAYLVAFAAAILLDQPFGPILVAILALPGLLRFFSRR